MRAVRRIDFDGWRLMQWPTDRAAEWVRALTENANVEAIVAIGSAARGRAGPSSDVDVIVICKHLRNRVSAPPEVDARWVPIDRLRVSVGRGDDVVAWGVASGSPLHDPNKTWHGLVAEWRDRLPLPDPDVCAQRAARARGYTIDLIKSGDDEAASEQALTMLTHEARLTLSARGVFPASRPELVEQLYDIGASELSMVLSHAIQRALDPRDALAAYEKIVEQRQSATRETARE
jgi:hypothetical protein